MKQKGIKATAATALLSAAILGGPVVGSAHGSHGHDKGYSKDSKHSYQMMEKYKEKDDQGKIRKNHSKRDRGDRLHFQQVKHQNHENEKRQVRDLQKTDFQGKDRSKEERKHVDKVKADKPNKVIPTPAPVPAVTVADVTAYGDNNVLPVVNALETAEANVDWTGIQENSRVLSSHLKKLTSLIDKLNNQEDKESLINTYIVPSQEALADAVLVLNAHRTLQNAENSFEKGKVNKAVWKLIKARVLTNKLDRAADDSLQANLQSRIDKLNAKIKETYNKNVEEIAL